MAKNTPEGEIVKDYRRAKREGIDLISEMIKVLEKDLEGLVKIKDFVWQFKNKKMSIKEFLQGPALGQKMSGREQEEIMQEILAELILGMDF